MSEKNITSLLILLCLPITSIDTCNISCIICLLKLACFFRIYCDTIEYGNYRDLPCEARYLAIFGQTILVLTENGLGVFNKDLKQLSWKLGSKIK